MAMDQYQIYVNDELDRAHAKTLTVLITTGILACAIFLGFYWLVGDQRSSMICLVGLLMFTELHWFHRHTINLSIALQLCGVLTYVIFVSLVYIQGGIKSPTLGWLILVPLFSLAYGQRIAAYIWTLVIVATVTYFYLEPAHSFVMEGYIRYEMEYRGEIMAGLFVVLTVFLSFVERSREIAIKALIETSKGLRETPSALKQSNLELQSTRDTAIEQTNLKSRLMANISHELRTPLTGVLASIDLLLLSELTDAQSELVGSMESSSQHFIEIINDVLDFSKLEAGRMTLDVSTSSIQSLVNDASDLYRIMAEQKGLKLTVRICEDSPSHIQIDVKRVRQIMGNQISNAIKFTNTGEINIELMFSNWKCGEETLMRLSVADTGSGVPSESQEHVFSAFYQVDSSLSRPADGTGLGLAICSELAKLIGGAIRLYSEPEFGSIFVCELPVMVGEREVSHSVEETNTDLIPWLSNITEATAQNVEKDRMLVVDDEPMNRRLLQDILRKLGYDSDQAANGEEAVEAVKSQSYQLIFMDCRMPVIDGIEATRLIREDEFRAAIPAHHIFALTGDAQENIRLQCLEAGVNSVMSKPFRFVDIRNVMTGIAVSSH